MRFVRADSVALVKKKMVVTGDAYIELTRGTGAELPKSGGEIACAKDTEIIEMLEEALEAIRKEAINTLALINGAIAEYMALGGTLNDPEGSLQMLLANANGLLSALWVTATANFEITLRAGRYPLLMPQLQQLPPRLRSLSGWQQRQTQMRPAAGCARTNWSCPAPLLAAHSAAQLPHCRVQPPRRPDRLHLLVCWC